VFGIKRPWCAVVVVDMATQATESGRTATNIRVDVVKARGAVDARLRGAFVNVLVTVATSEPSRTDAPVVGQQVHALSAVLTRF